MNATGNRVTVTRGPNIAHGVRLNGFAWFVYCPCCATGARLHQWHRALYWAIGHAATTHPVLPRRLPREDTP